MRSGPEDSWTSGPDQFWDTAVKGSSALRAALLRSMLDETAMLAGAEVATLLLDIEKMRFPGSGNANSDRIRRRIPELGSGSRSSCLLGTEDLEMSRGV